MLFLRANGKKGKMSLDATNARPLRRRSDAIDRNIRSLLRGTRERTGHIYIYIIKKDDDDDGDITGTGRLHKRKFKRGLESERSSDNIVASRISPGKRIGEERVVERITTGRCNPLTRDFTRRLGERNN